MTSEVKTILVLVVLALACLVLLQRGCSHPFREFRQQRQERKDDRKEQWQDRRDGRWQQWREKRFGGS